MARIYREDDNYEWIGTEKRSVRMSKTLRVNLNNPTMLPSPDNTWCHPNNDGTSIILSTGNSKVNAIAKRLETKAVAYGKNSIFSCPFASGCVRFCYQNKNKYPGSNRLHGHNYWMVYAAKRTELVQFIAAAIATVKTGTSLVRLNDNGDFISVDEILAWADTATNNTEIVFYGYTKNTPHLYRARKQFGQFPSNLRISISDTNDNDPTMAIWMNNIQNDFAGEFRVCHIIDTFERGQEYSDLTWNDEEWFAIEYSQDFKIALHLESNQIDLVSDEEWAVSEFYAKLETELQVC